MYNLFLKKDIERHDREESEIRRHLSIVGCLYIHTVQLSVNLTNPRKLYPQKYFINMRKMSKT